LVPISAGSTAEHGEPAGGLGLGGVAPTGRAGNQVVRTAESADVAFKVAEE
jgi:hypothetical protein